MLDEVLDSIDRITSNVKAIEVDLKSLSLTDLSSVFLLPMLVFGALRTALKTDKESKKLKLDISGIDFSNLEAAPKTISSKESAPKTISSKESAPKFTPSKEFAPKTTSSKESAPKFTHFTNIESSIEEIRKKHTDWVIGKGTTQAGDYPGCPKQGIRGKIGNFDHYVLYSVEVLMYKAGLDLNGACGIVGNLMLESGLLPIAFNRSAGGYGAQGIAQWRQWFKDPKVVKRKGRGRIGNYVALYGKMPVYDDNFDHQIDFVVWELNNHSYMRPRTGATVEQAAIDGCVRYEGATADPNHNLVGRIKNAKYAYNLYMNVRANGVVSQRTEKYKRKSTNQTTQGI